MAEYFSIKRSDAWLWTCKLTREEVLARLEKHRISRDWLICPLGAAHHAVTLAQFLDDPAIFRRLKQQDVERENLRRAIVVSVEKPWLLTMGQELLRWFFLCLGLGGNIVTIFFPQMKGAGLTLTRS